MPDLILTEEEQMLQTTVRDFVDREIAPKAKGADEKAEFQWENWRGLADLGLTGLGIDTKYGGSGPAGYRQVAIAAEEVARGDASTSVSWLAHLALGTACVNRFGNDEQKERLLTPLASGEAVAAFALTEPSGGSDAAALQTTAAEKDGTYFLNGSKMFITNASVASTLVVFATEDRSKGYKGISAFLVERGTSGLDTGKPYKMMGQAGSLVSEVYFNDCRVPAENLMGGKEGVGFRTAMKALNRQRIHLAALSTGPAMRMLDEAVEYAMTRKQFGQPIGEFQLVQAMIADSQTDISAARALILETARDRDLGKDIVLNASICKYFATEMCGRVADRAVQIFGGSGYVADYSNIERFYRDVRLFRLYEGTSQIHQLNIAKHTKRRFSETGTIRP